MAITNLGNFSNAFKTGYQFLPPRGPVTIHQKAFFLLGLSTTCYWLYRWCLAFRRTTSRDEKSLPINPITTTEQEENTVIDVGNQTTETPKPTVNIRQTSVTTFDQALKAVVVVFLVLSYYFVCDYLHYFPKSTRIYNRDLFIFLLALLFIVNIVYTSKCTDTGTGKLLNREQTEEWKGWMQVMFVWYHYFRAVETYNAVRIFIACYVWMTGFGNFSFFLVKKDFSIRRIFNSLFRLNFLVLLTTVATNNQYMLYYICAMHTFWYVSVYIMMRPFHQYNEQPRIMFLKFTIYFAIVFIVFDIPGVSTFLFSPLEYFLSYNGSMHEWIFRSSLDHYATLIGMLCAYFHPNVESFLKKMSGHSKEKPIMGTITIVLLSINILWYKNIYTLEKYSYNILHPYTCFIPMLTFIFLRNSTSFLRRWHCALFTFLGKITLETYISQLHIYLQEDAKSIIVYIANYPLLNFLLNTFVYIKLSIALFHATITLNLYIFPGDTKKMWKNISIIFSSICASYAFVYLTNLLFV